MSKAELAKRVSVYGPTTFALAKQAYRPEKQTIIIGDDFSDQVLLQGKLPHIKTAKTVETDEDEAPISP